MITFDLSDLERSESRSLRSGKIISRNRAELGHVLLLNIKKETIYGESNDTVTFDLD